MASLKVPLLAAEHRILVDAQKVVDVADLGNGGLTNTYGADGIGLHNVEVQAVAHGAAEDSRGHPSRRASAHDDDAPDA